MDLGDQFEDGGRLAMIGLAAGGVGLIAWGIASRFLGPETPMQGLGQQTTDPKSLTPISMRYGGSFDSRGVIGWTPTGIAWGPYFGPNRLGRCNPKSGPVCASNMQTFASECELHHVSEILKRAGAGRYAPHCLGHGPCEALTNVTAQQTTRAMTDGTFQLLR